MNPFDLPGPQYLLFYASLTAVTLIVLGILRRKRELAASDETPRLHDPFAIACLRGGKNELLRVAAVSLVDRGLLTAQGDQLTTTVVGRQTAVRKRIEQYLLEFCRTPRDPEKLFASDYFDVAVAEYERELSARKLLPDDEITAARRSLFLGAAAVLSFFSFVKIGVAVSRGRFNFAFLIIMTVMALLIASAVAFPRLTSRGNEFVANLRNLFKSLRLRAPQLRPGGANADLVLAAAIFGVAVLPKNEFRWIGKLFPRSDSSASSSGSSCGSSCGSSGGCGGGGGCGGCGG